tara:strand:+ start:1033 stop:1419 length:387 start_codon:yes stop_codon:yes gene_type:complete
MEIFEKKTDEWSHKVNFVDDENTFVGYDLGQDCCEHAGWFISEKIEPYDWKVDYEEMKAPAVADYIFNKTFFQEVESSDLDDGCMVAFKLQAKNKPDLYLHLFNCHNGYYSHGFIVKHNGAIVKDDRL